MVWRQSLGVSAFVARGAMKSPRDDSIRREAAEFSHLAKPVIIWADENICTTSTN